MMDRSWLVLLMAGALAAFLYLVSQLSGLLFPPDAIGTLLFELLPQSVLAVVYAVLIAIALFFDQVAEEVIAQVGAITSFLLFVLLTAWIARIIYYWRNKCESRTVIVAGLCVGTLFGTLMLLITIQQAHLSLPLADGIGIALASYGVAFMGWGMVTGWLMNQLHPTALPVEQENNNRAVLPRRQFLWRMGIGTALSTFLFAGGGRLIGQQRRQQQADVLVQTMERPSSLPSTLQARLYTYTPGDPFPEFMHARYQPTKHPIGVCCSGGGMRAATAAWGQLRGLQALGLIDSVGALSCVSGGAWCGAIWSYAPSTIDEERLLGPVLLAEELTPDLLTDLDSHAVIAPFTQNTTDRILAFKARLMRATVQAQTQPFDRVYSRILNEFLLQPFGLDNPYRFFTLNELERADILANNPGLTINDFYVMRPNRPFFIANLTHAWPLNQATGLRHVESTPLYTGFLQSFPNEGIDGMDLGGGMIESFAFDSDPPIAQAEEDGLVTVPTSVPPYLLSDMLGATSSAPGILLNHLNEPEWFPKYRYWSPMHNSLMPARAGMRPATAQSTSSANRYSFTDGAALENLGIIPLLRRQYPLLLVFVNGGTFVGEVGPISVDGINQAIARLFGFLPEETLGNDAGTQIFPQAKFQALRDGLHAAKASGSAPFYVDSYPILQPNRFDLLPYPSTNGRDPGEVTIVWFHEDINQRWVDRLPQATRERLQSTDPTNYLANFPHYDRAAQNRNRLGIPQLLHLTPEQINLLAHMWCDTILRDAGDQLLALRDQFI